MNGSNQGCPRLFLIAITIKMRLDMETDLMAILGPYPVVHHSRLESHRRILIVDDHTAMRRALRRAFERAGWDVCGEAANGREAIAKAEQVLPNVIVLDLAMPEINGLTAARVLKRVFPEVHLILFTGHGDLFKSDEALTAGISAVCSKSEPVSALLEKAATLVGKHSVRMLH
jgi:DNA-binding NarL/FixJ family response regulator